MKLKAGIYWGAACGGCDVAILDTHEKILTIAEKTEIYLWPVAMDFKYEQVRALEDDYLDFSLYSGAIRNSENEEIARLLRKKSKVMIALGACAHIGGIPGLANFHTAEDILNRVYLESESTENQEGTIPQVHWKGDDTDLELPKFYNNVKTLDQVVEVDYYIPGCPPVPDQIVNALMAVWEGELPPPGSVIGAGQKTLCEECPREREEKEIREFKRTHQMIPEPEKCLLEQGLLCLGPVTRSGCGARCIKSGVPCRGCYGPMEDIPDQGIKMLSALASVVEPKDEEEIEKLMDSIADPLRTLQRFSIAASILRRKKI